MTKTIYKYSLSNTLTADGFIFSMPIGAKIVKTAMQRGTACLWAEIDKENLPCFRKFVIVGTGDAVPKGGEHIETFFEDPYVWHLYEVDTSDG